MSGSLAHEVSMVEDTHDPLAELARLTGEGDLNCCSAPPSSPLPEFLREARLRRETQALLRKVLGKDWRAELLFSYIAPAPRQIRPPPR